MPHSDFETLSRRAIASLNVEVQEYRHKATGARHVHLAADDNHNAFLVAFLTVPQDSTGVAHILEHTALCGSRRYPVRDPFFMMIRRSLNTFMNAFTASDWTAYPFASQNIKDFNNLLDVYLDAAFFPLLDELDFAQEGHRLELEDERLVFKGVVYNEMKGAMSSPVSALSQCLQSHLFPTTTYHYNSGGDPACIPDLTYAQLRAFHARHYHPSNALFMTYGNIPADQHQRRFQDRALHQFQALAIDFAVPDERRYPRPLEVLEHYALDSGEETAHQTHITLGWLWGRNTDPLEVLRYQMLSDVLLDNSSSPLRRALETTPLGSAPSPLCGFDDATRETSFVAGLEGSDPEQAAAVEELILGVIRDVAEQGVPQETLDSVLHQLELSQREITGDGFPYGLRLMMGALTPAIHGGDPTAALDLDPLLDTLRQEAAQPGFIQDLAQRLLLDNPHRVRLVMPPDPKLGRQRQATEEQRLAALRAGLDAAAEQAIRDQAAALEARQRREDDPEQLPKVGLEDIPTELSIPEGEEHRLAGLPTTWYAQGTNGMVYQQAVLDLPELDSEAADLLPLFCLCLTEVGSAGRDYLTTQAVQAAVTGGLSARPLVRGGVDDVNAARGVLTLAGKALTRNHAALAELLRQTLDSARFDETERLRELVAQSRAQRQESITDHGHLLAMAAAASHLGPVAALNHRWDGLQGLKSLQALDRQLDSSAELANFISRLENVRQRLRDTTPRLLAVAETESQGPLFTALEATWEGYPGGQTGTGFVFARPDTPPRQGWAINAQVNFCAMAFPTVAPNHPDTPAFLVLGDFLRNGYLHRAIREQGGAYGGGAGYQPDTGVFRFFSYRDPRLEETLADFRRSLDWLHDTAHPPRALEEAILGVIGAIDRPGSPAGEAISAFYGKLFGRTPEQRRTLRSRVLAVTLDDLRRVAETWLKPERAGLAVLGPGAALERASPLQLQVERV